jgi:protein tyrosine/serine phosphatase
MVAYFYEKFSFDKLDHFSEKLHNYITANTPKPVVYYIHCSHGVDRTGLVSGVYKMKYQNMSLKQVVDENFNVGQRDMLWTTYYGLLWYC